MILNEWRRHNVKRHEIHVRLDDNTAATSPVSRSYKIHVGDEILQHIGDLVRNDNVQRAVVVSDQSGKSNSISRLKTLGIEVDNEDPKIKNIF